MRKLPITIATNDYDHFRDFKSGAVEAQGVDPIWLDHEIHEIFTRFAAKREWHVSEMSFAKFTAQVSQGDCDIIGLPVFPSRVFRLSSIYVNTKAGIQSPADLRGKRIGLPEWAQTAAVYTRGWLEHDAGVPLTSVQWVQAGTEDKGRTEKVPLQLPNGLQLVRENDKTLSEMIVTGEVDAIMCASQPSPWRRGDPSIRRLFDNPRAEEEAWFKRTGVYPIMHVIAMRKDMLEEHPWVARNLLLAFEESKRRSMARIFDGGVSRYPIPWMNDEVNRLKALFGGDFYPYGIEPNRKTLAMFLTYCFEQGVAKTLLRPDDIFPEGLNPSVKT